MNPQLRKLTQNSKTLLNIHIHKNILIMIYEVQTIHKVTTFNLHLICV